MAQRMRFLLHQKVPPFGVVRRVRCPFSYGHRDSCRRASSLAKTSAPRSLGRLVDPAHSPVTGPAALADGDCRLAVVLASTVYAAAWAWQQGRRPWEAASGAS